MGFAKVFQKFFRAFHHISRALIPHVILYQQNRIEKGQLVSLLTLSIIAEVHHFFKMKFIKKLHKNSGELSA